jgi:hypothetical protein
MRTGVKVELREDENTLAALLREWSIGANWCRCQLVCEGLSELEKEDIAKAVRTPKNRSQPSIALHVKSLGDEYALIPHAGTDYFLHVARPIGTMSTTELMQADGLYRRPVSPFREVTFRTWNGRAERPVKRTYRYCLDSGLL